MCVLCSGAIELGNSTSLFSSGSELTITNPDRTWHLSAEDGPEAATAAVRLIRRAVDGLSSAKDNNLLRPSTSSTMTTEAPEAAASAADEENDDEGSVNSVASPSVSSSVAPYHGDTTPLGWFIKQSDGLLARSQRRFFAIAGKLF